jgi:Tol biopolymer transport system component
MFGGNNHFFFLPPLVPAPTYGGDPDGTRLPVVRVCEWNSTVGQCSVIVADFNIAGGTGSESIRYDAAAGLYIVNWHTDKCTTGACTLDVSKIYRLRVLIGNVELGFADIDPVNSASDLRNTRTGGVIPLVNGRTLPIKFRIEKGALAVATTGNPVSVGSTGGTISGADGKVALKIPVGALTVPTSITVQPAEEYPAGVGAWTTPQEFGPAGTTFLTPVTLTLRYDPSALPEGVPSSALRVAVATAGGWDVVPNSVVNGVDNTVSVAVSHFSIYAIVIAPNTVSGQPLPTALQPGQMTAVSANITWSYETTTETICEPNYQFVSTATGGYWSYVGTNCYTPSQAYSYLSDGVAIYWESSAPNVAYVPVGPTLTLAGRATTPLITGGDPGVATIRAVCCGSVVSNAVTITVQLPPVGPRIAFSRAGGTHQDTEIYVMRSDGTGVTRLTNHSAPDEDPHFSPDGSKIAFTSFRSGNSEIWVMDADGANPRNLTNDGGFDAEPAWSPDGTRIAFNSCRGGNCDIYVINADGTGLRRLTFHPTNDGQPTWSASGSVAFISDRTGNFEITVVAVDQVGSPEAPVTQLTATAEREDFPAWSPDGQQIAFARNNDLYVMNSDGANVRRLTTDGALNERPAWTPDSQRLVFSAHRGVPQFNLWEIHVGTGEVRQLTVGAADNNHPSVR